MMWIIDGLAFAKDMVMVTMTIECDYQSNDQEGFYDDDDNYDDDDEYNDDDKDN